jgi:hypothetical protein
MTGISSQSIDLLSIFSFQAAFLIENYLNLIEVKKEMKKLEERQDAIVNLRKNGCSGAHRIAYCSRDTEPSCYNGWFCEKDTETLHRQQP